MSEAFKNQVDEWTPIVPVKVEEYIDPESTLGYMLNYHHGFWRFFWHWHSGNKGVHWPDWKTMWAHRKYCEESWDKIGFGLTIWRLSFSFSCQTHKQSEARYREMFPNDIQLREIGLD